MRIEDVIGYRIAESREQAGLTLAALGQALGELLGRPWPRQTVSTAEKGRRSFTSAELVALAIALEVPVGRLLTPPIEAESVSLADTSVSRRTVVAFTSASPEVTAENIEQQVRGLKTMLAAARSHISTALNLAEEIGADVQVAGKAINAELPVNTGSWADVQVGPFGRADEATPPSPDTTTKG